MKRRVVLQALQNVKHGHDLLEKAWRFLHVKKHEADMIYHEARLRRSELFCEAHTSARTACEPTTDDEGIDDFAPPADNVSEDREASEEVASCEIAEPTVDANKKVGP